MKFCHVCLVILSVCAVSAYGRQTGTNISLGTAGAFGVLAGSTVTNTGPTVINGDVGVFPGSVVTGFPPGSVTPPGSIYTNDGIAQQAQNDLTTAYNLAAGETGGSNLSGQDLGGLVLTPGVYTFSSSAQLTGLLTLNDLGNPNADFVFQIGSTLTTASGSSVVFSNGLDDNVFWQVGSSATLGTTTDFSGNILANTSITLNTGANIGCGSALAENGAVTLDTNTISTDGASGCQTASGGIVPEPGTGLLFATGPLLGLLLLGWRSKRFGQYALNHIANAAR